LIAQHESPDEKPISLYQPRSPVTECFRSLRTNTTFAGVDKPLRRILVTSATPQEGKTTITSNLAVVLAQNEKKVALIDADLRPHGVIQNDEVSKLAIITSGKLPPNPAELLTSQKMAQFLEMLNREYDMILLDTPPVLNVTDAVALSTKVDGTILVAKPGVTKLKDFQQALEQLKAVGAHVLGVVLNEVDPRNRRYGYYYHRYYSKYSNYYGEPSDRKKAFRGRIDRKAII
jgi:Mrp family chromosome partitioning ATPase